MNAERLLAYYDRVGDAPDAISRLRRFVLNLAVRGKLVPQDPNDEPASELLKRVAAEKARLVKAGEIRKENPPGPASASDLAFDLRDGWRAATIKQVLVELQTGPFGSSLHQSDYQVGGTPVINPASIQNEQIVPIEKMAVGPATLKRLSTFKLRAGDIVMGRRGEMGRCAVVTDREEGWLCGTGSLILRLPRCVYPPFFVLVIGSPYVREYLGGSAVGTTMQNLNQSILLNLVIGLPPLAEQRRIVTKVDELMELCDRLEAARTEREAMRERLTAASLARLNAPDPDPAIFAGHAGFALSNLPALTTRPDQIKQLRHTILSLAVRGKLVPQDPNDESASELLARFAARKSKNRSGRNWTARMSASTDQIFEAPDGWAWTRIADTCERVTVGYVGPMKDQYVDGGVPFLRSQNVRANRFREEGLIHISPKFHQTILKSALAPGDVVVVRSGNVGTACVIPPSVPEANCSDLVVVQRPECILSSFLCFYLNSLAESHVEAGSVGVALTHFNTKSVATMPIALPPLAEQQRIVAKVDTLMALCDRLEVRLSAADTTRRRLLETLLGEALAPIEEAALPETRMVSAHG
jgi:type I restriction enzyme S subunit